MKLDLKTLSQEQYLIPIKIVLVFVAWRGFDHFAAIPGTTLHHIWYTMVDAMACSYAAITSFILSVFGMASSAQGRHVYMLASGKSIFIAEPCLGIRAVVIFASTVILFKGKLWEKTRFLITGVVGIILINLLRVTLICVAWVYLSPFYFVIHHEYIYAIATYGFIFFMIARWMNRIIDKDSKDKAKKPETIVA